MEFPCWRSACLPCDSTEDGPIIYPKRGEPSLLGASTIELQHTYIAEVEVSEMYREVQVITLDCYYGAALLE